MQQSCSSCGTNFEVTDEDLAFYDKVSPTFNGKKYLIPPPKLCPEHRLQRRLAWRNERSLHKRICDATHTEIVSVHSESAPYPVYNNTYWWSDSWDGRDYGTTFDDSRPFFEQYIELYKSIPQIAIVNDNGVRSENCEYCQDFAYGKNCYLVFGTWDTQDSYYSNSSDHCKNVVDCFFVQNSEYCYECQNAMNLNNCKFVEYSENCRDCSFGSDLIGCKDCFMCCGIRQKQYCVLNQQYSKDEYEEKIKEYDCSSNSILQQTLSQFQEWLITKPKRSMYQKNCENCTGDSLFNCKNTLGFNVYNADHSQYYDRGDSPIYSHDVFQSGKNQYCYEGLTPDESYQTLFTTWCWKDKYVLYSDNCHSCTHCFGCVSLKRMKYCIFNKQYSKEEYEKIVPTIIEHMISTGEWGEFFPIELSPFGYNETVAPEYFPLTKDQITTKNWKWCDQEDVIPNVSKSIPSKNLPDSINDIPEDILNWAVVCGETGRPFKIIKQELEFYRKMELPVPHFHPEERQRKRMVHRGDRKFWTRNCDKCQKEITSTWSPERPEMVYCEQCYLETMY